MDDEPDIIRRIFIAAMEDERRTRIAAMDDVPGSARRTGVAQAPTAMPLMQALRGLICGEQLSRLKAFVVDRGPEMLGDFCSCPWAKWTFIILIPLLDSLADDSVKRFIAGVFGRRQHSDDSAIKSPLQIVVAFLDESGKELKNHQECKDNLSALGKVALLAMILSLIMAAVGCGWSALFWLHVGMLVAQWKSLLEKGAQWKSLLEKGAHDLCFFQAVHVFFSILNAVAPPNSLGPFLLPMVGLVFAVTSPFHKYDKTPSMIPLMFLMSSFVMIFYTPLWFGVCFWVACFTDKIFYCKEHEMLDLVEIFVLLLPCFIHLASGGVWWGALFVFLCPILLCGCVRDLEGMLAPLPLVLALMTCLLTSFRIGLCFTSMLICFLAAANNNGKAILWWFVSFAALHLLSYAFTRSSFIVFVCFMGSYFSYGCLL